MSISKVKIIGERNSGTNFLKSSIALNFDVDFVDSNDYISPTGHKHFMNKESASKIQEDTLVLCSIRNYTDWVNSMRIRPYHLVWYLHKKVLDDKDTSFFNLPFISVKGSQFPEKYETEIVNEDLVINNGNPYKNIAIARNVKMDFYCNRLKEIIPHYKVIRYEDFKSNYEQILKDISTTYNLPLKDNQIIKNDKYKGLNTSYSESKIKYTAYTPEYVLKMSPDLDLNKEKSYGYNYNI